MMNWSIEQRAGAKLLTPGQCAKARAQVVALRGDVCRPWEGTGCETRRPVAPTASGGVGTLSQPLVVSGAAALPPSSIPRGERKRSH
jgi:hypothetical protein